MEHGYANVAVPQRELQHTKQIVRNLLATYNSPKDETKQTVVHHRALEFHGMKFLFLATNRKFIRVIISVHILCVLSCNLW